MPDWLLSLSFLPLPHLLPAIVVPGVLASPLLAAVLPVPALPTPPQKTLPLRVPCQTPAGPARVCIAAAANGESLLLLWNLVQPWKLCKVS